MGNANDDPKQSTISIDDVGEGRLYECSDGIGELEEARGELDSPFECLGVRLKNLYNQTWDPNQTQATYEDDEDEDIVDVYNYGGGTWDVNCEGPYNCHSGPGNVLVAVTCFWDDENEDTVFASDATDSYSGVCPEPEMARRFSPLGPDAPGEAADPLVAPDGWFRYNHLSVAAKAYGNRLRLKGMNLKARTIAVAADNVAWRYGRESKMGIRRAVGLLRLPSTSSPFLVDFHNLPAYSICIRQRSRKYVHVITSHSKEDPTVIDLDPEQEIYVLVNGSTLPSVRRQYTGGFDLWVKPLD